MKIKIIIISTFFLFSLVAMEPQPNPITSKATSINHANTSLTMLLVHHIAQQLASFILHEKARTFVKPVPFLDSKASSTNENFQEQLNKIRNIYPELYNKIRLMLSLYIIISKATKDEKHALLLTLWQDKSSRFIQLLIHELLSHTSLQEITELFPLAHTIAPIQPPFAQDKLSLMHVASMLDDASAVECLLSFNSTSYDRTSVTEDTPCHYAARYKSTTVFSSLTTIQMTTKANKQGVYPLTQALVNNNKEGALFLMNLPEFKTDQALIDNALEHLLKYGNNHEIARLFSQELKKTPFYKTLHSCLKFFLAIAAHANDLFAYPSKDSQKPHDKQIPSLYKFALQHVNFRDPTCGLCPLHIAAAFNNLKAAEFLVSHGAHLEAETSQHFFSFVYQATPLLIAARKGHFKMAHYLLTQRKAHTCSSSGISVLHCAAMSTNLKLIRSLLNYNKQLKDIQYQGATPLHIAVLTENVPLVQLFLEHTFDKETTTDTGLTALAMALQFNEHPTITQMLLESGALIPELIFEESPLCCAVTKNWLPIVKLLVHRGIAVNKVNLLGLTPLAIAAQNRSKEIFDFLLLHDQTTDLLQTALEKEDTNILSFLLDYKLTSENVNFLCRAITLQKQAIANLLIDRYSHLLVLMNEQGETPLHTAVLSKNYTVLERLIAQPCLISLHNTREQTPLDLAHGLNDDKSITLLSTAANKSCT